MGLFKRQATERSSKPGAAFTDDAPSKAPLRGETRPEVIARLEALDDVIFAAIDGDRAALEQSSAAWQEALNELGRDALEETRQQYLRRARNVWQLLRDQPDHPRHRIFAAIEIIGLLVNVDE